MKKLLTLMVLGAALIGCTKDLSQETAEGEALLNKANIAKNKDKEKKECTMREYTYEQLIAKGKKPTRPPRGPKNNNDTPPPPPPPPPEEKTIGVLLVDFDGHTTPSTSSWGVITAQPSTLTQEQKDDIMNRIREDYSPFSVMVTTDEIAFYSAPSNRRMRCVVGNGLEQYFGRVGGIAYVNSLTWGTDDPCWVLADLLGNSAKNVAEASSHEFGHTVGLRHQARYDGSCVKTEEYNSGDGSGALSFAPIMGVGYYRNVTGWVYGTTPYGCTYYQDDIAIITQYLPIRGDDVPSVKSITPGIHTGTLETPSDVDEYQLPTGTFTVQLYSGGNADIAIDIMNNNQVVATLDDPTDIHVSPSVQTGTFSLRVRTSNIPSFIPKYSMCGRYSLVIQ